MDNYLILPKTSDQSLLAQYYSLADVFVICSKRENFPTTCIEAQCCGAPVVGFDTGGTKETSVDPKDGFVSYGDLNGLSERIRKYVNKDKSEIARKAHERFANSSMSYNYLKEYDLTGRKERILLIDVNCKYSSTGKIVYDLYNSIRDDGREAAICYGRGPVVSEPNIYKFGLDWETLFHAGLSRLTGFNGCFSTISTKRLIGYIDSFKPDLIHIHELHAYFVNIKMLINYIKEKHIPVVWTFHCEYMYTGKCGHANECTRFQNECGKCPALHAYPKSLFFDQTKKMLLMKRNLLEDMEFTIISPSEWLKNRIELSYLSNKRIKTINNGINTDIFKRVDAKELRDSLGIPTDYKVVVSVAPNIMSEEKGGQWVLKIAEKMKNEKYFFLLVGDNEVKGTK